MIFGDRIEDETRRTVDLGHSSDGPSWIDLTENRVTTTESRFAACLNGLLQQNRPLAEVGWRSLMSGEAPWSFLNDTMWSLISPRAKGISGSENFWSSPQKDFCNTIPPTGEGFAVDASLIQADANKQRSIANQDWRRE